MKIDFGVMRLLISDYHPQMIDMAMRDNNLFDVREAGANFGQLPLQRMKRRRRIPTRVDSEKAIVRLDEVGVDRAWGKTGEG